MQKTPIKGTHTRPRGLWPNKLRIEPRRNGELLEKRADLARLLKAAREKTDQLSAILREKAVERNKIENEMKAAFRKPPSIAHQKALVKARMELENHFHRTMRELDLKKSELKKIYHKADRLKEHLRKG